MRASTLLIGFVFFLSGLSALIFETLWFRQSGLAFGTSVWASALVLSSFMAGLATGNGLAARYGPRVRRPLLLYAGLELLIGFSGLSLVLLLPELAPLLARALRPVATHPELLRLARFSLAFVLLVGPAIAMGATLPLLVKTLFGEEVDFGRLLGRLYGINTFGAVAGAVTSELVFIPLFGVLGSGCAAAGLNAVAAALALLAERGLPARGTKRPAARERRPLRASAGGLLAAACLSGGALLALEVVWFRLMVLFVAQTTTVFAWMLGIVLSGIAMGGLLASLVLRFWSRAHALAGALALLAGVTTIQAYRAFPLVSARFADPNGDTAQTVLPLGLALMLPTSVLSGMLFTFLGKRLHALLGSGVRTAGLLTLANTLGSAFGPLLASFVLLPRLGVESSLRLLAISYAGVAVAAISRECLRPLGARLWHAAAALLFAWAVATFPSGLMRDLYLWFVDRAVPGERLIAMREGVVETIGYTETSYLGEPYYHRLVTDGYSMSGTALPSQRYMSLFAHIPLALHPEPRDALLISFGVGITAKALTRAPELKRIDVVDISRDILEMSFTIAKGSDNALTDPRVRVHVEDGRYFLQTTEREYDLITGEPPPPAAAGVVNLYTVEYFRLLRGRLREGGVASYWLPVEQLALEDSKEIVRSFCTAFDDCTLWEGSPADWILVGSRGAGGPLDEAQISRQWTAKNADFLGAIGIETPELLAALFLADTTALEEWTRDTPPLVDNWPHRAPRWRSGHWPSGMPAEYAAIANETSAKHLFERSRFLRRVWPAAFRERSRGEFSQQQLARRALVRRDTLRIHDVHRALTETTLRTLPLWLLGSDADRQAIAERLEGSGSNASGVAYELGLGALARRDYAAAVHLLDRANERTSPRAPYYALYAVSMTGDLEEARARTRRLPSSGDPGLPAYWSFMRTRFGLDRPLLFRVF